MMNLILQSASHFEKNLSKQAQAFSFKDLDLLKKNITKMKRADMRRFVTNGILLGMFLPKYLKYRETYKVLKDKEPKLKVSWSSIKRSFLEETSS